MDEERGVYWVSYGMGVGGGMGGIWASGEWGGCAIRGQKHKYFSPSNRHSFLDILRFSSAIIF